MAMLSTIQAFQLPKSVSSSIEVALGHVRQAKPLPRISRRHHDVQRRRLRIRWTLSQVQFLYHAPTLPRVRPLDLHNTNSDKATSTAHGCRIAIMINIRILHESTVRTVPVAELSTMPVATLDPDALVW